MTRTVNANESPRRNAELAKIHIGAKQLCDDEQAYRDMLEAVAGKRSAGDLDAAGRRKVLEHLAACGAKFGPASSPGSNSRPKPKPKPAPTSKPRRDIVVEIKTIDALCINHPGGRKPRAWAEAILQRMEAHSHRVPLEWSDAATLRKLAQAIRIDIRRHEKKAEAAKGKGGKGAA